MTQETAAPERARREVILGPLERQSEVIFGLIMALSITGSLSVVEQGQTEVRTMMLGALGCNLAWGIIDGLMYLVTVLVERSRRLAMIHAARSANDPAEAHRLIADSLPTLLAETIRAEELEHLREKLMSMAAIGGAGLTLRDLLGALGVFLLVFLSTLPIVVPFLLPVAPLHALRISNGVAVVMLFGLGYDLGRYAGRRRVLTGLVTVAFGAGLVGLTIALGG